MSSYTALALNPLTNEEEMAEFLDDYYGRHIYAVRFKDGHVYPEAAIKAARDKYLKEPR